MITRASVHFRHWEPNFVYQHCIFCFFSITFCSQSVWRSLVCFHFLSSYAGLDCTICWSAICFLIYNKTLDCITKPLLLKLFGIGNYLILFICRLERVWSNLSLTSKNLAHRLIHFKVIHRAYITPYKDLKWNCSQILNCHICNTTSSGTFLHMFWECPVVISLWTL